MSDRRVRTRWSKWGPVMRSITCETLEGRFLFSGVVWTGAGDGMNWTDSKNWSSDPALPGAQDDVTIPASAGTIHLASGDQSVHSLMTAEALSLDGGSLAVATAATSTAAVTLNGGSLNGGVWTISGHSLAVTGLDSKLEAVTLNATLDLSTQNGAQLTVLGGLAVNGTVLLGSASGSTYGRLVFGTPTSAAGALSGRASVVFGRSANNAIVNQSNAAGDAGVLTLATDTIHGISGTISAVFPNGGLLNRGTIAADGAGTINLSATTVVNDGVLSVGTGKLTVSGLSGNAGIVQLPTATASDLSGLTLDGHYVIDQPLFVTHSLVQLNGNWSATATITEAGGTLHLGGVFSVHPGEIVQIPGTSTRPESLVAITGTLIGDLNLDASTGSWSLSGGSIVAGTITETQGAVLRAGGTLNGVTVNGPLDVIGGQLTVLNSLVLNGTMRVGLVSPTGTTYGSVTFGSANTPAGSLTGNAEVLLGGHQNATFGVGSNLPGPLGELTIGPGTTVHGAGSISGRGGIINNGIIMADADDVLSISGPLTNNATLGATNASELDLFGAVTNNGTMRFQSQGVLDGFANLTVNPGGRVVFVPNPGQMSATLGSLTIVGSGVVDIGNTVLRISYPDALHRPGFQLRSYIRSGSDGGRWDGPGIVSSLADANHVVALADSLDGVISSLPPLTVAIQVARTGDLNLDGKVDLSDLLVIARHWGEVGANWDQGDLDYDGSVTFADLLVLARSYGQQGTTAGLAKFRPASQARA